MEEKVLRHLQINFNLQMDTQLHFLYESYRENI